MWNFFKFDLFSDAFIQVNSQLNVKIRKTFGFYKILKASSLNIENQRKFHHLSPIFEQNFENNQSFLLSVFLKVLNLWNAESMTKTINLESILVSMCEVLS
jgi:hypothetical protein